MAKPQSAKLTRLEAKKLQEAYDLLPVAILLTDEDFGVLLRNARFKELMRVAKEEFGTVALAEDDFIDSLRQHRNKKSICMRLMDKENIVPMLVVPSVLQGPCAGCRVFTIFPDIDATDLAALNKVFMHGKLRVDTNSETAYYGRKLLSLSVLEFTLLATFAAAEDRVLTKEVLLRKVWGKRSLNTRTIDVYISRLKKKLGDAGCDVAVIKTVHGRGYIFDTMVLSKR